MPCKISVTNLLKSARVTMAPVADSGLSAEKLFDGPGGLGALFSDLTADPTITIDLSSAIEYGNGATPGDVAVFAGAFIATTDAIGSVNIDTDWTLTPANPTDVGSLQLMQDSDLGFFATDHGGNGFSLALAGDDVLIAKYPLVAQAGGTYRVEGWAVNGNTTGASIRLFNPLTGLYLHTDGTWGAVADLVLDSTTGFVWLGIGAGAGVTFSLPSFDDLGAEQVTLQLHLVGASAGFTFYDDLALVRILSANLLMVTGNHNINSAVTPVWQKSDNGSSWTTVATMTKARFQFWALLPAPVSARFFRLKLTGTPTVQNFVGDLFLGLTQELPQAPQDSLRVSYAELGQARQESAGGTEYVSNRGPYPVRTLEMSFRFLSDAEETAAREIILTALRGGANECVIFPSTLQYPRLAIYGRIQQPVSFSMNLHAQPLADSTDGRAKEHYSDLALSIKEGPGFELRD
jgi:hypothetical protein